jgi:hypothetical protein
MLFDHQIRIEMARDQIDRLHGDWGGHVTSPARHALGTWLIRLGERLAPERRSSALAHEALPRC